VTYPYCNEEVSGSCSMEAKEGRDDDGDSDGKA
jgi:hypothetical protein